MKIRLIALLFALSANVASFAQIDAFAEAKTAAEAGDADAQYQLGKMFLYGQHTQISASKAYTWISKAADQGLAAAQFDLGSLYDSGEGTKKDFKQAAAWYHKAALQAEAAAQYNLGVMFEMGDGVQQDNQQAYIWFSISDVYGYPDAKAAANKILPLLNKPEITDADDVIIESVNKINKTMQQR